MATARSKERSLAAASSQGAPPDGLLLHQPVNRPLTPQRALQEGCNSNRMKTNMGSKTLCVGARRLWTGCRIVCEGEIIPHASASKTQPKSVAHRKHNARFFDSRSVT